MSHPETPQPTREQREQGLQRLDPTLTPEFWEHVREEAEDYWLEKRGLTLEEYNLLVYDNEDGE